jgi:hypothetical protein
MRAAAWVMVFLTAVSDLQKPAISEYFMLEPFARHDPKIIGCLVIPNLQENDDDGVQVLLDGLKMLFSAVSAGLQSKNFPQRTHRDEKTGINKLSCSRS